MNDDERFEELKEKEIKRLTTPPKKIKRKYYDCEGVELDTTFFSEKPILEPKKGILNENEILNYAGNSKEASKIRLKRGIGDFGDKKHLHGNLIVAIIGIELFSLVSIGGSLFILLDWNFKLILAIIYLLPLLFLVYLLFIKNYKESQNQSPIISKETDANKEFSKHSELLLLFESKEKIAREMIEKKFPAPQLTNTKFNSVLDNCHDIVESQIEILNALTLTDKTKYEIDSRKKLIKQLITKIDDLTNELILSEESNIEEVIEDMDNLIGSVKDYK